MSCFSAKQSFGSSFFSHDSHENQLTLEAGMTLFLSSSVKTSSCTYSEAFLTTWLSRKEKFLEQNVFFTHKYTQKCSKALLLHLFSMFVSRVPGQDTGIRVKGLCSRTRWARRAAGPRGCFLPLSVPRNSFSSPKKVLTILYSSFNNLIDFGE